MQDNNNTHYDFFISHAKEDKDTFVRPLVDELNRLGVKRKNEGLEAVAKALILHQDKILAANEKDVKKAKENQMKESLVDRLSLTEERIEAMAEGLTQIVALEDPNFIPDASNSVYCIFMIIGIIGYFCVPTVSSWIIQAGGAGAYGQKVGGAGKMAGNGAAAVGGAVGGSVAGRIKKMF